MIINHVSELGLPHCGCGEPELMLSHYLRVLEWYDSKDNVLGDPPKYENDPELRRKAQDDWSARCDRHERSIKTDICQGNETLYWLTLYTLDQAGLSEHGSNVQFGWLTNKGTAALIFLRKHLAHLAQT